MLEHSKPAVVTGSEFYSRYVDKLLTGDRLIDESFIEQRN